MAGQSPLWQSANYQDDVLTIPGDVCTACNISIAVVPWQGRTATYTLTITKSATTLLTDGVQVRDQVLSGAVRSYDFTPPTTITAFTVTVTQSTGTVQLNVSKVSLGYQPNDSAPSSYSASVTGQGDLVLTATAAQSWFCSGATTGSSIASCRYHIAVLGLSASGDGAQIAYTIRASTSAVSTANSTSGGLTLLTNSVQANTFTGAAGTTRYFYLELVPSPTPRTMTITLTSLSGDADVYYKFSTSPIALYPKESSADGAAYGDDPIDLITIDPALPGYYYIAVNAWSSCTYRLLATIYNETKLTDGIPQSGVVTAGQFKFFNFTLFQSTARLTVTLFKTYGEPDLYVRRGAAPTRSQYDNASLSLSADVVTFDAPGLGVWVVGVYGFDTSVFTVTVSTSNSSTFLSAGKSITGQLASADRDFYAIFVDDATQALTVTLTLLAGTDGDCDLYMSSVETQPSYDNFQTDRDYWSEQIGSDAITISQHALEDAGVPATWYIGVDALTACFYTLTATFNGTTRLSDGAPQAGTVPAGAYAYYAFTVVGNTTASITVSVSATIGSVQLLVNTPGIAAAPSVEANTWETPSWLTGGSLTITPGDTGNWCSSASCTYAIAVLGTGSSGGSYSLTASATKATGVSTSVVLQDGVSSNGRLQSSTTGYYQFVNLYPQAAIVITVTPSSVASDPDLFVSTSTPQPSAASYAWKGIFSGADAVYITPSDPAYVPAGKFYIAVFCAAQTAPCSFSLLARAYNLSATSSPKPLLLTSNVELTGLVAANGTTSPQTQYYQYVTRVNTDINGISTEDVIITLTPLFGDPDLYVGASFLPNSSVFTQSDTRSQGGVVIIPAATVCTSCSYFIAVTAFRSIESLYTVRVQTGPQTIALRAGAPYTTTVAVAGSVYFALQVDHKDALAIVVTSISGDADVYAAFAPPGSPPVYVTTSNSTWSSIDSGTDTISIGQSEIGRYYILVYGYRASTFTVLATLGATALYNTIPQHDYLHAGDYRLYVFFYGEPATLPLSFVVNPTNYARSVNMYVTAGDAGNTGAYPYPTPTTYTWIALGNSTYANNITIPVCGDDDLSTLCVQPLTKYYLRIDTSEQGAQYDVVAYYGTVPVLLSAGRPLSDTVAYQQCKQYRAFISLVSGVNGVQVDASVDATEAYGDVSIYVSTWNVSPSPSSFNFTSGHDPSTRSAHVGLDTSELTGTLLLVPNAGNLLPVYIAVCGEATTGSSYSLLFSTAAILLPLGRPQAVTSTAGRLLYFFIQTQVGAPNATAPITLTMYGNSADGSQDLSNTTLYTVYGCNDQLAACRGVQQPNTNENAFISPPFINGATYTLPLFSTSNMGTYWLGVQTSEAANFTLIASQRSYYAYTDLPEGATLTGTVENALDPEFYMAQRQPFASVLVMVDLCVAAAFIVISNQVQYPVYMAALSNTYPMDLTSTTVIPWVTNATGQMYLGLIPRLDGQPVLFQLQVSTASTSTSATAANLTTNAFLSFNNPGLTVTAVNGGFTARWTPAVASAGISVRYLVYWTLLTDFANLNTVCGCSAIVPSKTADSLLVYQPSSTLFGTVSMTSPGLTPGTYKVNVVAGVAPPLFAPDPRALTSRIAGSNAQTVIVVAPLASSSGWSSATLAAIAVPIVVVVVAFVTYLCYRNTKLQAELDGVDMKDVPRQQVIKAMQGVGFRRRAQQRLTKPKGRYNKLLEFRLQEGTEMSVSELGLDSEEREDGEAVDGDLFDEDGDEQRTYTLDAVLEHMQEDEEKEGEETLHFST